LLHSNLEASHIKLISCFQLGASIYKESAMRKSLLKRAVLSHLGDESLGSAREREYLRCARSRPIRADIRGGP
jgi:hypothetical protein